MLLIILFIIVGLFILGAFITLNHIPSQSEEEVFPYRKKRFFFSRSEQEFFRILEANIDHHTYSVFPKVRLADFVEVTNKEKSQKWFNSIKSKHIDFLIWNIQTSEAVLAIELDGNSHNVEHMQKSDVFKDKLYPTIGLELVRIQVGSNFQLEIKKILQRLSS